MEMVGTGKVRWGNMVCQCGMEKRVVWEMSTEQNNFQICQYKKTGAGNKNARYNTEFVVLSGIYTE